MLINNLIINKLCFPNHNKICPQCTHHNAADTEWKQCSDFIQASGFQLSMLCIPGPELLLSLFTTTWIVTVTFYQDLNCHILPGTEMSLSLFTRKVTVTHHFKKMASSLSLFNHVHPYYWLCGDKEFYIHCPQVEMYTLHSFDTVGKNRRHRIVDSALDLSIIYVYSFGLWHCTVNLTLQHTVII